MPGRLLSKLHRTKGPLAAFAAGGALLGGLAGYWNAYHAVNQAVGPSTSEVQNNSGPHWDAGPLSVMVFPFVNQTGDVNKSYVADGLTSSITSDLSRIRDAFVLPATSALSFADKKLGLKELGAAAGVRFVLSGSVRASGNALRIDAQLADTASGAQLWSEVFEGDLGNLFALQDQVTARIGNSIGPQMVIVAARESQKRKTAPKVVDLLLQARALALLPDSLDNSRAIENLLRKVLLIEPNHADATARLAALLNDEVVNFKQNIEPPAQQKLRDESMALALRAQTLDPNNPLLYTPLSYYYQRKGDQDAARKALEKALELAPKNPVGYNELGLFLLDEDIPRAVDLLLQGLRLGNPNLPHYFYVNLASAYFLLGDYRQAIDYANRCIQNQPRFVYCLEPKAWSYALLGEKEQAAAAVAELLRVDPQYRTSTALVPRDKPTPRQRANYEKALQAAKLAGIPD